MLFDVSSAIRVEEITNQRRFEALEAEWERLWRKCSGATPFQSPHWLLPWWKHFGGSGLWCLALRSEGELAGLAPFFVWERKLLLIGTGISDYLDILLEPDREAACRASLFACIDTRSDGWHQCDWQQLPAGSPLRDDAAVVQDVCPVLDLTRDIPMLKRAAYYRRHASLIGELRFECATEQNLERCLGEFLRLHRLRWRSESVLVGPAIEAFHHEAASRFLRAGMLRLYLLLLNGQTIAAWYGFEARKRFYYYLGGFDPAFEKLSPGAMLIGHAIDEAREHGVDELDFLRGQERYKYLWGACDTFTYRRQSV